jgi:hypothetical protein
MKLYSLLALVTVSTILAACGGGGGGGGSDAAAPAVNPSGSASKYVGSWASICEESDEIAIKSVASSTVTTPAYTITTFKNAAATSASSFAGQLEERIFDNTTCAGTAKATQSQTITFTIDGTAQVSGKTVDKVTAVLTPIGGLSSGGTVNINGIVYPGDFFTRGGTDKDLLLVEGNKLYFGGMTPDASGYPTTIDLTNFLTKQ